MAGYQIFADTTADLCPEMLAGLPPVRFIPMEVDIGGRRYLYGPGGDLTVEAFYALQRAGNFASTTQIAPETFTEWFEPVLAAHPDAEVFIAPIGPVIGAHTGPGMLALIYWGNDR